MRILIFLLIFLSAIQNVSLAGVWDFFPPQAPRYTQTIRSYLSEGIKVSEVRFLSRPYREKPSRIFGYYCRPASVKNKLPAILLVHGGGGSASLARARKWARYGAAVLAIDLPGKGEKRACSRSTGPNMDVPILLKSQGDLTENYLVHAVAAARSAISFLYHRPEVDRDRIGMIGLSWGGVVTLLTNGQDDRLKAAVNVFGAGHIPEGCTWQDHFRAFTDLEAKNWNEQLDPGNFLSKQHAPIYFVSGTNDHCYYLPTFQKSYEEVKAPKNLWLIPGLRHSFQPYMENICINWILNAMNAGSLPANISEPKVSLPSPQAVLISAEAQGVKNARLYYNRGGPSGWTRKKWTALAPYKNFGGVHYFSVPARLLDPEILYYIGGSSTIALSTPVRSIIKCISQDGKITFAFSRPIKNSYRHEPPLSFLDGKARERFYLTYSKPSRAYLINTY